MNSYDVNLNSADCLTTMTHFGFNRVHNICTGTATDIPWGAMDWGLGLFVSALALAVVVTILAVGTAILRDY
jgi:hypothetical protein